MILSMVGEVRISIRNFRPDTSVNGSKMRAADIVIENVTIPCVIRRVSRGNIQKLNEEQVRKTCLTIFNSVHLTLHKKRGFVDMQITIKEVQFCIYVQKDHLEKFLGAYAASIIRAELKI